MKRTGSIYSRSNKENVINQAEVSTKRKDSFDIKSNCTAVSLKDVSANQIKSTSDDNDHESRFYFAEQQMQQTIRSSQNSSIHSQSVNDSMFDSLAQY